jgi:transcriptional regulator with PAS, ATPase and Fis domain
MLSTTAKEPKHLKTMPLNNVTIPSIISSKKFQEECLSILLLASEICNIPVVILSYIENNNTTIIAKTGNGIAVSAKAHELVNIKVVQENKTQEESDSNIYLGLPISFGNETTNGTLCFWDSKPRKSTSIELKIAVNIAIQIQNLYQLQVQKLAFAQKEFYKKILDRLPTEVAVFDQNHKYLYVNPAAIQNDELRKYIIEKTILNMLNIQKEILYLQKNEEIDLQQQPKLTQLLNGPMN